MHLSCTLFLAILELSFIDNAELAAIFTVLIRRDLREFALAVHDTLDHISMIVSTVVEQNGAVTVGPVVSEVTL